MKKKILIITKYEWDDRLASGNTLSNFFEGWDDVEIYNIYCRDTLPNNNCCQNYFSVSPLNIVKNVLRPWKIGQNFVYCHDKTNSSFCSKTESSLKLLSKKHQRVFDYAYDILYSSKLWLNRRIKEFIGKINPDMVFVFGTPDPLNYYLICYLRNKINVPVVTYFVDDHYNKIGTWFDCLYWIQKSRLKKIAEMSSKCYAISQPMCEEYSDAFKKEFTLLFKGCDISYNKSSVNSPIRFVYAGNMLYGRNHILTEMASILASVNNSMVKTHLDIYTSTILDVRTQEQLNIPGVSTIHAPKPYKEIKKILRESDVVLHVESFEKEQINIVRLSFSTKITDCLQSGSMTLAIGPPDVASIQFLKKVPGAIVVDDIKNLQSEIISIISNLNNIVTKAKETNDFVKENLDINKLRNKLRCDLTNEMKS